MKLAPVPIHYKISAVFAVIVAVILSLVFFYLNFTLTHHSYKRLRQNLKEQTNLSRSYVEYYFSKGGKFLDVNQLAGSIAAELNLRVTIIGSNGVVYGESELDKDELAQIENHYTRSEIQAALRQGYGEDKRRSSTVDKDLLYRAVVFDVEGQKGFIRLAMPLEEVAAVSQRIKNILFLAFLSAFLFMIVVSFLVSSFISRPLRDMAQTAHAIAGGDFSKKISPRSDDEIGRLARAFNHMSEQIQAKINEVVAGKTRLEAVFLSMFEGVMIVDEQGSIALVNKALKDFLSIQQEPYGKKPLEVIRNIAIQEIADQALKSKTEVIHREIITLAPQERILLVHATAVKHNELIKGAVLVFHDITDLRRLETIRRDFVANVSHELRTPITTIKGYAETLRSGALDDKEHAKEFIDIIYEDARRLSLLIDDILDLAKIESGSLALDRQAQDLAGIIETVIKNMSPYAQRQGISIEFDRAASLPKVIIDRQGIEQVLVNLIDNAIKYNKPGGSVTIKASIVNGFIEVGVADSGIGIAEEDLPRVFERFYRVDRARSRDLGGTGLGLAIVKHIVQAHSGRLNVDSSLGEGSLFRFTLPIA